MFVTQFALKCVDNWQEAAALLADDCMETRVSDQADLGRTKPEKPRKQFSHAPPKKAKTFKKLPKTSGNQQWFFQFDEIFHKLFLMFVIQKFTGFEVMDFEFINKSTLGDFEKTIR